MIDLGERKGGPAPRPINPVTVRLLAAFAAGLVLGGAAVAAWWNSRPAHTPSVRLAALASSAAGAAPDVKGVVRVDGRLAVINAGAEPVTVRSATGTGTGVAVTSNGQAQVLRPGDTGLIGVTVRVECATVARAEPLAVDISVDTADGQRHEDGYAVTYAGSAWDRGAQRWCALLDGKTDLRW